MKKVFLAVDVQGLSRTVYWPKAQVGGGDARDSERQREALAGDLDAVVEGARRGEARQINVLDFHGSSPPRPNLLLECLDPSGKLFGGHGDIVAESQRQDDCRGAIGCPGHLCGRMTTVECSWKRAALQPSCRPGA